jgi:hypothetical protein
MCIMAPRRKKQNRSPAWVVNTRLDLKYEEGVERYIAKYKSDHGMEPSIKMVIEKALHELLKGADCLPDSK